MNVFASLVLKYLASNPQIVERLATLVLTGLIEHIAPSTASSLVGAASAAPLSGLSGAGLGGAQAITNVGQAITR